MNFKKNFFPLLFKKYFRINFFSFYDGFQTEIAQGIHNFFCVNAHIQFKVGIINASISKVCERFFWKNKTFQEFVNFDQFFSGDT